MSPRANPFTGDPRDSQLEILCGALRYNAFASTHESVTAISKFIPAQLLI